MQNLKYQPFLKSVVCISLFLSSSSLTASSINSEELCIHEDVTSRQSPEVWRNLIDYSYEFLNDNNSTFDIEKNESGFYRINIPAPDYLQSVEKLRLHYWPISGTTEILAESIHDHPRFFESYIVQGGYRHALYTTSSSSASSDPYTVFKVNKLQKIIEDSGKTYLHEQAIEKVKEHKIVVMPTDALHRVLTYVPGTLSMNVVYNDPTNKDYYNVFISQDGSQEDVKTERLSLVGTEKESIIKEVKARLCNRIFQAE